MKRIWMVGIAYVLAACGGKVRFESGGVGVGGADSSCEGLDCGDLCETDGVCDEKGQCRFDDFTCPAECVAGACGEPCTACVGADCFDGVCDVDLFCRPSAVCPTE
jgi:hypothetical protein